MDKRPSAELHAHGSSAMSAPIPNRPTINNRLRSLGYQPPGAAASEDEQPEVEALPCNAITQSDEPEALPDNKTTDPYLLRALLWCGLCDEPFACCLMSTGIRSYGCMSKQCPRPLVNAEEVEQVVWKGFVLRHEAEAAATKRNERQAVLHAAIARVTVSSGASELDVEWRE